MNKLKKFSISFLVDESGATSIEYALIAALIAISLISGASSVGKNTNSLWNNVTNAVDNV